MREDAADQPRAKRKRQQHRGRAERDAHPRGRADIRVDGAVIRQRHIAPAVGGGVAHAQRAAAVQAQLFIAVLALAAEAAHLLVAEIKARIPGINGAGKRAAQAVHALAAALDDGLQVELDEHRGQRRHGEILDFAHLANEENLHRLPAGNHPLLAPPPSVRDGDTLVRYLVARDRIAEGLHERAAVRGFQLHGEGAAEPDGKICRPLRNLGAGVDPRRGARRLFLHDGEILLQNVIGQNPVGQRFDVFRFSLNFAREERNHLQAALIQPLVIGGERNPLRAERTRTGQNHGEQKNPQEFFPQAKVIEKLHQSVHRAHPPFILSIDTQAAGGCQYIFPLKRCAFPA